MGRLLRQESTQPTKPSTNSGITGRLLNSKVKPLIEKQPVEKIVTLSDQVGGGQYKTSGPGSLILSKRGYGSLEDKTGSERDHKVPVALGGTSDNTNLHYLLSPNGISDPSTRQQGKTAVETQAIQDYKDGKISLPQARLLVMAKNQDIQGLIPKQGTSNYLLPAAKETIIDPIKQGVKDTFGFIKNVVASSYKNKSNFGNEFVKGVKQAPKDIATAGKDIAQTTASSIASFAVDPIQTIRGKDQVYTPKSKVTQAIFGKEPIKGVFKQEEETKQAVQAVSEKLKLDKNKSALLATIAAPLIVSGLKTMDLTPFGGAEKAAGKAIIKDTVEQVGKQLLKDSGKQIEKDIASSVISYIDKNGEKVFTKLTTDELSLLKNEIKYIPEAKNGLSQIHLDSLTDNLKNSGKEVSREAFIQGHPQVKDILPLKETKNILPTVTPPIKSTFKENLIKEEQKLLNNEALANYGTEGKTIFDKIKNASKEATFNKSEKLMSIDSELKKLSVEHLNNFGDYVEGKLPTPPEAQKAVDQWKEISGNIAKTAQDTGLTIKTLQDGKTVNIPFTPRDNYYPQIVNDKAMKEQLSSANYEKFVTKFANENNVPVAKAQKMLNDYITQKGTYGNLEKPRLGNLPSDVLERNPRKILPDYISRSYDRLSIAKEFGGNDQVLNNLVEQARQKGYNSDEIYSLTNRLLGREKFNEASQSVSAGLRAYNNITKLSLSAVTNLGDITKIPTRTNLTSTLKGIVQSFTKPGKEFAGKAGVLDPILDNFAKETGIGEKLYKISGFKWTESKLRQTATNASKNYIDLLATKLKKDPTNEFLRRRLEQFDLNPDNILKNGISKDDYTKGAIKTIADLQPTSATDIPHYWQSPTGKLLTQYKTFAYKQMKFAKEFIYDEAKKGNIKPLVTFLIVGQAVGEGVGDVKSFLRGRERPDKLTDRLIDNYMTIGGVGMISDFVRAVTDDTQGSAFLKFVGGPTISDINDYLFSTTGDLQAIKDNKPIIFGRPSNVGERQPKTLKKVIATVPFVGPFTSNKMFPTKEAYKARTPGSTLDENIIEQIRGKALPENNDPWGLFK